MITTPKAGWRRLVGSPHIRWSAAIYWSLVIWVAAGHADDRALTSAQLADWGAETLRQIDRDYLVTRDNGRPYYAESFRPNGRRGERPPAFMWSCGVHLSALAAATAVDPQTYGAPLTARRQSLEPYWHVHREVGGYDVLPNPQKPDRYYDDNAWIALALCESHQLNQDAVSLSRAEEIHKFLMSGKDDKLEGGIYWRENELESKNTCINAPAALAALMLHEATGRQEYLDEGRRLYEWTTAKLQDPDTGLFWDNIALDGTVDRRFYTYNSAVMLRATLRLFAITRQPHYLDAADRIGRAAIDKWIDPQTGGVRDSGKFAHMLLEALLELAAAQDDAALVDLVLKSTNYVHEKLRDENGRYGGRWDGPPRWSPREYKLIDQASSARLYFRAAQALRDRHSPAPSVEVDRQ